MTAFGLLLIPAFAQAAGMPAKMSRVYSYRCTSTFFEGEGLGRGRVSCVPGQKLGVITVEQTQYFRRAEHDVGNPVGDAAFPNPICGRNSFLKHQCTGNVPVLAFGLSAEKTKVYSEEVKLPAGPGKTATVGYGMKPGSDGTCPEGLQRMQTYRAKVGKTGLKLPNNVPTNGGADDVRLSWSEPAYFHLVRQPNAAPCDAGTGDCSNATFAGAIMSAPVPYRPVKNMVVCVVPAHHFTGEESGAAAAPGGETSAQ